MKPYILDASALIACVLEENGTKIVERTLENVAYITSVNLSEAIARLLRGGIPLKEIPPIFSAYPLRVMDVDTVIAYEAASLEHVTKKFGLSLGDRICLAAAIVSDMRVITADRVWAKLPLPSLTIQVIR